MKIESIKRVKYKGLVYNLEVEEDESYVANSIVVHNCRVIAITAPEVDREIKAGRGIEVSSKKLPSDLIDKGFMKYQEDGEKRIEIVMPIEGNINNKLSLKEVR